MGYGKLYIYMDPSKLERISYVKRGRRPLSRETIQLISRFRKSLQSLVPRELNLFFLVKIMGMKQEDVGKIQRVRQSNSSFHLIRIGERLKLMEEIYKLSSETQTRRVLFDLNFPELYVKIFTAVCRVFSQTNAAIGLSFSIKDISQAYVRQVFNKVMKRLLSIPSPPPEIKSVIDLGRLVEKNYGNLVPIASQSRWIKDEFEQKRRERFNKFFHKNSNSSSFPEIRLSLVREVDRAWEAYIVRGRKSFVLGRYPLTPEGLRLAALAVNDYYKRYLPKKPIPHPQYEVKNA